MDDKLKRDIILEHYQSPHNRGTPEGEGYLKINSRNESCVDNLDFYIKIEDDTIIDIRFTGEACAISTSAASMMAKKLSQVSIKEAAEVIDNFENMIAEEGYDEKILTELTVYDTIYKQPSRKACATLPFRALKEAINGVKEDHNGRNEMEKVES